MITEYMHMGSVDKLLSVFSKDLGIIYQICNHVSNGMTFLHSHDIIHRDLATRNILVQREGAGFNFKVCDFGYARLDLLPDNVTEVGIVPIKWTAPEGLASPPKYHKASDVWSFAPYSALILSLIHI
eukprot:TRINITY_DN3503_c0_g1_i1.p1 TRINITY_DN3503_c0_g1~~TRINITY_DN3503_c0_g1_i1.p1  ORF type:complete len:127 (+),score=8.88 TRINITY_DN3503_c0_g1_i1:148-528(+)